MARDNTQPDTRNRNRDRGIVFLIATFSLAFASKGLLNGYSYWLDELFSVNASMDTWENLYKKWILPDVHPPLYQIALKAWISLFSTSEVSTRMLSFLFSAGTLAVFSLESIRTTAPRRVLALLLIGVSPSFAYYSQETRSYSMALLLASLVTVLGLRLMRSARNDANISPNEVSRGLTRASYYVSCILLSLTHYFGLIFTFSITLVNLKEKSIESKQVRSLALLGAITLWPLWHISNGEVAQKTGGNFWIQVKPIVGTLNAYLQGCIPILRINVESILGWSLIAIVTLLAFRSTHSIQAFISNNKGAGSLSSQESRYLMTVIITMICITAAIDLKSPISTDRNFIVLLPATMILIANSIWALYSTSGSREAYPRKVAATIALLTLSCLFLRISGDRLVSRTLPSQNWKALATYVQASGACYSGCLAIGPSMDQHKYYFSTKTHGPIENLSSIWTSTHKGSISRRDQWELISQYPTQPVLGFHIEASESLIKIADKVNNSVCLQPNQGLNNNTFIVVPKHLLDGKERDYGMKPCDT